MKQKRTHTVGKSLRDTWLALVALIKSMYKAMPFLMIVFTCSIIYLSSILAMNVSVMICILSFIIVVSSIAIYVKAANYGEAVLSLAAGLLTVFTVEWTAPLFVGFMVIWVLFTIVVFLIISVRTASKIESVFVDCINVLKSTDNEKNMKKMLERISASVENSILMPIERAEIIRLFCFRKISIEYMTTGLKWVNIYYAITRIAYLDLATFVSDVIRNTRILNDNVSMDQIFEHIHTSMRNAPVSPQEYMCAFTKTRYLLASSQNTILYFKSLTDFFNSSLPDDDLENYLKDIVIVDD